MRRQGATAAEIEAALLAVNERRCQPPLDQEEARKIAVSIARYPSARARARQSLPVATPWPAPLAQEASYGLAGDLVRLIEPHTEADPVALLLSVLVGVGNMIGRGPHFVAEGAQHFTNLYAIFVGSTSRSRKGSSWAHILRLLDSVDPSWRRRVQSGLSSGEGLIWHVRDAITKMESVREKNHETGRKEIVEYEEVIEDPGVEDKRLLAFEGEFASVLRVMSRDGNTLSTVVRNAWDTGDLSTLVKNSPAKATGAQVSIIGHITHDEVLRYFDRTELANGFGNRFLFACVRRSRLLPDGGCIPEGDFGPVLQRMREAVEFARTVGEMSRDEEARTLWHEVYPTLTEGMPGLVGAVTARAEAQVMRLALFYALLDLSPAICREHLAAALAVWRYCEDSVRFIFGDTLGDPVADQILRGLRAAPDGLTRTAISDLFGRNKDAHQIAGALARLLENGLAGPKRDDAEHGRPAERWHAATPGFIAQEQRAPIQASIPAIRKKRNRRKKPGDGRG